MKGYDSIINVKNIKEKLLPHLAIGNILLLLMTLFACSLPFVYYAEDLLLDTAVQVKTGMIMIEQGDINGDIFSWHEGLNWIPHEKYWYLLLGWVYSKFEVPGLMCLSAILNLLIALPIVTVTRIKDKPNLVYCIVSLIIIMYLFNLPINSIRPHMMSTLVLSWLMVTTIYCNNKWVNISTFMISVIVTTLFHGGSISIPFMVYGIYTVLDLVFSKKIKDFILNLLALAVGFGISLIVFGGFDGWTYLGGQSVYPSIMELFVAFKPMAYEVPAMLSLLIIFIGLFRQRISKITIMKTAYLCMFVLACAIYARMILHLSIIVLICLPNALDSFIKWVLKILNSNKKILTRVSNKLSRFKSKFLKIKEVIKNIVTVVMIFVVVFINVFFMDYNNIHTINDAASTQAWDNGVIDFIKEKGYYKVYNNFNIGTWLIFNNIKVNIDNRVDPYLTTYGNTEDHFHGQYSIDSLTWLNNYCERYNPDCLIFYYDPDDATLKENGQEFKDYCRDLNFINEIDKYELDRFKKVYENTVEASPQSSISKGSGDKYTWVIYEYVGD